MTRRIRHQIQKPTGDAAYSLHSTRRETSSTKCLRSLQQMVKLKVKDSDSKKESYSESNLMHHWATHLARLKEKLKVKDSASKKDPYSE